MRVLLLVDIQNDFLPGGALAVPEGDTIIPVVNKLIGHFDLVIATQDWHPPDHGSFASNHPGKKIGEMIELHGLPQVLWPDHCVQNTEGAKFSKELKTSKINKIFQKGTDKEIDSYSGFFDNGHKKSTGLDNFLKEKGVTELYITGLATDYCVKYTALDARKLGFRTYLVVDACKGVNLMPGDVENAIKTMADAGVTLVLSEALL